MKPKQNSVSFALCILIFIIAHLSGCSDKYISGFFNESAKIEQKISIDKEYTIGNASKNGWEIALPKNTFGENTTLTMTVLSDEESKPYEKDGFTLIGTPVSINVAGKENVRLHQRVKITRKLPKDQLKDLAAEELFFGYYHDDTWEYYLPENINMHEGTATFNIDHFSYLGFGKPSEERQIETYAKTMAVKEWNRIKKTEDFKNATSSQFDELFKSIGVTSKTARNQLAADVISYLEDKYLDSSGVSPLDALAQMGNSASQGREGMQAYKDKLLEYTGKALIATMERDPSSFATSVNIVGNLASAAGAFDGGDKKAALESVANMLKGAVPQAVLADAALNYVKSKMEDTIEYWTQSELEKAYQVYATGVGGKWSYQDGLKGEFDTIYTLLGGIDRQMNIRIIKQYCQVKMIDESELTQAERDTIIANAKKSLKNNFDKRIVSESAINKIKEKEKKFIEALKNEYLLSAYDHKKYFGIHKNMKNYSITERLDRLYTIKNNILAMMDKDQSENISDALLAKAIRQWIYLNEQGDMASFYRYMRNLGYIKNAIKNYRGVGYWRLSTVDVVKTNLNKRTTGSLSQGSGQIKTVCDRSGDVFAASMEWSSPASEYSPEDTVALTISVKVDEYLWHGKNDGWIHIGLNFMGARIAARIDIPEMGPGTISRSAIRLTDKDGQDQAIVRVENGKTILASKTLNVSTKFRSGKKLGDIQTLYVSCNTGTVRYNYVWTE